MQLLIEDISPTYGKVVYRVAFQKDYRAFDDSDRRELCEAVIEQKFRTFIKEQIAEWKFVYYLPFLSDNLGWNPVGTKYGKDTDNKIKTLPIAYKERRVADFLKSFPECRL